MDLLVGQIFPIPSQEVLLFPFLCAYRAENKATCLLAGLLLLSTPEHIWGEVMLSIHVEQVGDCRSR